VTTQQVAGPDERSGVELAHEEAPIRVSTLELFFDLVFVFTVTQLTNVLVYHLDLVGALQVTLMFGIIWWMYGGYAWVTNAVAPNSTTRRTLLLTGMLGFLVIALAVPEAFQDAGWLFGSGYLLVTLVHAALFTRNEDRSAARAAYGLAGLNLVSALLVLAGGLAPARYRLALWAVAFTLHLATPYLRRAVGHMVRPGHFVERHSLVVIVAIGESIVAIGLGLAGVRIDLPVILATALALCTAYYLWWAYFAGDEERAEHALQSTTDRTRRGRLALRAWGYAHFPMLLGIVFLAAGVKKSVGHAFEPSPWGPAIVLAGGTALFLLGHAWFLRILGISGVIHRVVAAAVILATIPLGHLVAVAQLAAIPLIMATAMIIEDIPKVRQTGTTSLHTFGRTTTHGPSAATSGPGK